MKSKQKSKRNNKGKIQTNEIDPAFILGMGEVLTKSREFYDRANWTNDTPFSVPWDCALRHMMKFHSGLDYDEQTGSHHLLHAAVNLMFLHYYYNNQNHMDDRIFKKDKHVKRIRKNQKA